MVRFCPKCGGLMKPTVINGKGVLECIKCGYRVEEKNPSGFRLSSKIKHSVKEKTVVIEGKAEANLPVSRDVICRKCGNNEAYYWILQTRAADEPSTRFYKCTKCGHVWREYE